MGHEVFDVKNEIIVVLGFGERQKLVWMYWWWYWVGSRHGRWVIQESGLPKVVCTGSFSISENFLCRVCYREQRITSSSMNRTVPVLDYSRALKIDGRKLLKKYMSNCFTC